MLALATRVQPMLREVATPLLRSLADQVGATAHLTLADGDDGPGRGGGRAAVDAVPRRLPGRHAATRSSGARRAGRSSRCAAGAATWPSSDGELQEGAHGVSVGWRVGTLEGSVGVVSLTPLDAEAVGAAVRRAAATLTERLDPR